MKNGIEISLQEFIDGYLEHAKGARTPRAYELLSGIVPRVLKACSWPPKPEELRKSWQRLITREDIKAVTANKERRAVGAALGWGVKNGHLGENACASVLRWREGDNRWHAVRIRTRGGRERIIPLVDDCRVILSRGHRKKLQQPFPFKSRHVVYEVWVRAKLKAGIEKGHFHALRTTWVTLWKAQRTPPRTDTGHGPALGPPTYLDSLGSTTAWKAPPPTA